MASVTPNIKAFYKGQTIFKEGHEANVAYMIKKGAVNIYKTLDNKKVILARLKEGEIFGEMGVLAKSPRTANAEAAEYCDLMILTDQLLYNLLAQCPKTIQYLTKLLMRRLQRTGSMIAGGGHKSSFLSICKIFGMEYKNYLNLPAEEAKKVENYDLGLSYQRLCKTIREIILVSQLEIDEVFHRLSKLNLVGMKSMKTSKAAFNEKYIKMNDPESFAQVAENLFKELQKSDFSATSEFEYVDVHEFAEHVASTPEMIYKKMSQEEIPESLFFFNKTYSFAWADEKGTEFFQKVKKKTKKVEDFDEVNDVVFIDNATLKQALDKLGYHKIGVLLAIAEDEAKKKILANLAKKIAKVVQEESEGKHVDAVESEDVTTELIAALKELKGVEEQ